MINLLLINPISATFTRRAISNSIVEGRPHESGRPPGTVETGGESFRNRHDRSFPRALVRNSPLGGRATRRLRRRGGTARPRVVATSLRGLDCELHAADPVVVRERILRDAGAVPGPAPVRAAAARRTGDAGPDRPSSPRALLRSAEAARGGYAG